MYLTLRTATHKRTWPHRPTSPSSAPAHHPSPSPPSPPPPFPLTQGQSHSIYSIHRCHFHVQCNVRTSYFSPLSTARTIYHHLATCLYQPPVRTPQCRTKSLSQASVLASKTRASEYCDANLTMHSSYRLVGETVLSTWQGLPTGDGSVEAHADAASSTGSFIASTERQARGLSIPCIPPRPQLHAPTSFPSSTHKKLKKPAHMKVSSRTLFCVLHAPPPQLPQPCPLSGSYADASTFTLASIFWKTLHRINVQLSRCAARIITSNSSSCGIG